VQPKKGPEPNSAEANLQSYASVRGEEAIPSTGEVDVRLMLLTLLESMVRAGAADWKCGQHIAAACERLLCKAIVPNLVWRVGRVEATVRKVALAVCHGLMKAGAARTEALAAAAPELVPLLCSNLDDMDETARLMSCLCLRVMFERLRGAFGEQAVHELYPKLLKRLDDSSDAVRAAICGTLDMFMQVRLPHRALPASHVVPHHVHVASPSSLYFILLWAGGEAEMLRGDNDRLHPRPALHPSRRPAPGHAANGLPSRRHVRQN